MRLSSDRPEVSLREATGLEGRAPAPRNHGAGVAGLDEATLHVRTEAEEASPEALPGGAPGSSDA